VRFLFCTALLLHSFAATRLVLCTVPLLHDSSAARRPGWVASLQLHDWVLHGFRCMALMVRSVSAQYHYWTAFL
jgi:hypothetical protein